MQLFDEHTSDRINNAVQTFLESQLGEIPDHVSSYLNTDILTSYAFGVASPAEKVLMVSANQKPWIDYKIRQFDSVKNVLSGELEQIIKQPVRQIFTTITEDGIRIIHVCFK